MNAFSHPDRPLSAGRAAVVLALLSAVATPLAAQVPVPPVCVLPFDPVQVNPPSGRPTSAFPTRDHLFVHSATHLQGAPDTTKIAAGLIQRPNDDLADMTSAVSITNPDPLRSVTVTVRFLNHLGTDMSGDPNPACQTPSFVLGPEATRILPAVPLDPATGCTVGTSRGEGVGSARVSVAQGDPGIVGAVIHHAYCFFGTTVCDSDSIPLSNTKPPGATAMEQLQSIQDTDEVWAGPFPLTTAMVEDVLNGMAPIVSVTNPSATAPVVAIMDLVIFDPAAGISNTVPFRVAVIPPGGTWIESSGTPLNQILGVTNPPFPAGLWQQSIFNLLSVPTTDLDISVRVRSFGGPVLGNVLYTDFFANDNADNLTLGERFRMASTLLQGAPTGFLMNPEFSFEPRPNPLMETYVLLQNVGPQPTALAIEYFDNLGNLMAIGNVASLGSNQALRIVPGTFNYPAGPAVPGGPTGFGWMRIRACQPNDQLIGWTVREILDPPSHAVYNGMDGDHEDHFMKAYGEILMSTASAEPGNGFPVTVGGNPRTRKVSPLIRVDGTAWPGYSTAVNDSVSNLFAYEWLIFDLAGNNCSTNFAFPGLPFRFATFTYEDPQTLPACVFGTGIEGSARIDVSTGTVDGIDVIGDPMREWNIPDFADGEPPPIGGGGEPNSDTQP